MNHSRPHESLEGVLKITSLILLASFFIFILFVFGLVLLRYCNLISSFSKIISGLKILLIVFSAHHAPPPAPAQSGSGGSMFGNIGSTIAQGV